MAPEQAAGQTLDARADVYAAGVVLAEMVSPEGVKSFESRQSIWEGVRSEPAKLPDSPWAPIIKRAVAKDREGRFNSAHTLTRALEDVTLRVEGAEDLHPYPGLASFTEEDAEYFFGREAEVEQMWRKLEGPPRLLGLVGPSGAGKTSFLQAGLFPTASAHWATSICKPGSNPQLALGRALAPAMAGDADVMDLLLRFDDPDVAIDVLARWRRRADRALLVVDQFEELFTQNSADVQHRFAELLNRLVLEADVCVLLSMRDDFLMRCRDYDPLQPIFTDMTALPTLAGQALRRALVRPATKCGYRLEDDELVEEMLGEVEGERGALPLLAFAAARLWEKRDRETGFLTRQAYREIGGVGGALAQHAEATIDRIGTDHLPIVRELLRNLVTAEGTRAVREWDELLSVFEASHRNTAEKVLRALIDTRLLTSYEVREGDGEPIRRVEIVHESLLANWPRLVRWQTQDQEGVQLREELRQSARAWDEHDRHEDRLWTGSAFREFQLWRERYPGGLTETEEAFARAMTSFATRRKRRRQIAVTTFIVALLAGLAVVGTFWRRSVLETRRAEAARLLALAQLRLESDPTESLAYITASLELADTAAARSFALRVLWEAPPALILETPGNLAQFSPDGRRIATLQQRDGKIWSISGNELTTLRGLDSQPNCWGDSRWVSDGLLITGLDPKCNKAERVRLWSIPDGGLVRTIEFDGPSYWQVAGNRLLVETMTGDLAQPGDILLRSWQLPNGKPRDLGRINWNAVGALVSHLDPSGNFWVYLKGRTIHARPLPVDQEGRDRVVGTHVSDVVRWMPDALSGDQLAAADSRGELWIWLPSAPGDGPLRVIPRPEGAPTPFSPVPDPTGQWISHGSAQQVGKLLLWDLFALPEAQPRELRRSGSWEFSRLAIHPRGDWIVYGTRGCSEVSFWPLRGAHSSIVMGASSIRKGLAFSPDSRWLAATWPGRRVRLFPLPHTDHEVLPDLERLPVFSNLVFDRSGTRLAGGHYGDRLSVGSLNGGQPQRLEGFLPETLIESLAFSPSGQLVAAASGISFEEKMLRVWDLGTGELRAFELPRTDTGGDAGSSVYLDNVQNLWFTDEDTLITVGATRFLRWDLRDGSSEVIVDLDAVAYRTAAASADVQKVLIIENPESHSGAICDTPKLYDLAAGSADTLPSFGDCVRVIALDPGGGVAVTGDADGVVRVGRIADRKPHLLMGHEGAVEYVAVSPDLHWVASVGADSTLRLWPMPDLDKPPLHTLPHDELIVKLHSLTNVRFVRDEESPTGWEIEVGPFPGWATVPTW
jgi:WD40 repeat protein